MLELLIWRGEAFFNFRKLPSECLHVKTRQAVLQKKKINIFLLFFKFSHIFLVVQGKNSWLISFQDSTPPKN